MGAGCYRSSKYVAVDENTKKLDEQLAADKNADALRFKLLLLGAGESGKTTIRKQLETVHKGQLSEAERLAFAKTLRVNALTCSQILLKARKILDHIYTPEEQKLADQILALKCETKNLTPEIASSINRLWTSETTKITWECRERFWHLDASDYYFDNVVRFGEEGFMPTEEDIVMARERTTGIVTTSFDSGGVQWTLVDVGGQRSERRKWINCFDEVKAILFTVNLSGFNSILFEDRLVNRMQESLSLFKQTFRNPLFENTTVFLFLNKVDMFEEMLQNASLSTCFPEYKGTNDVKECLDFITQKYQESLPENKARAVVYPITARFTGEVADSFESLKAKLLKSNAVDIQKAKHVQVKSGEKRIREFANTKSEPVTGFTQGLHHPEPDMTETDHLTQRLTDTDWNAGRVA